jgi:hypothetical protein
MRDWGGEVYRIFAWAKILSTNRLGARLNLVRLH